MLQQHINNQQIINNEAQMNQINLGLMLRDD